VPYEVTDTEFINEVHTHACSRNYEFHLLNMLNIS
jgi:hypothetical protein